MYACAVAEPESARPSTIDRAPATLAMRAISLLLRASPAGRRTGLALLDRRDDRHDRVHPFGEVEILRVVMGLLRGCPGVDVEMQGRNEPASRPDASGDVHERQLLQLGRGEPGHRSDMPPRPCRLDPRLDVLDVQEDLAGARKD